jgi:peptidyl-prolyl cis-trans isomerase SurA
VLLDRVVATVDAHPILRSEVLRRARPYLLRLDRERRDRATVASIAREVISRMIDERLIELECDRARIRVEPRDIDSALDELARANQVDRPTLLAEAAKQGLAEQDYREELRRQLLDMRWMMAKVRPSIAMPLLGTPEEKARATAALLEAARKAELTRLRRGMIVEVRW